MPKYSPQHPILKQPQTTFLTQCERQSFTPIHNRRNYISVYLNLLILFLHSFLYSVMSQYLSEFALLLISFKETGYQSRNCIYPAKDNVQQSAVISTEITPGLP